MASRMGNDRSLGAHPSVAARAERRADRAVAQLRRALFLAGVGDELSTSLELDATVARVARLALDVPADWAIVEVPGAVATAEPAGAPRPRLSVTHANPADAAR